jgi:hypothetical protein
MVLGKNDEWLKFWISYRNMTKFDMTMSQIKHIMCHYRAS